jgi:NAD(P)-dependent dehydrogenase (short-subunit alcohol dehydrogenase family)
LRTATNNELVTAEQVDLASLYSVRKFATKWVDNAPPRRLDMIILCANTLTPGWKPVDVTEDGIDSVYGLNYVANFHLLSILSPAVRAQPPDRDVRILFATCASYMGGDLDSLPTSPGKASKKLSKTNLAPPVFATRSVSTYATSKLALTTFAHSFQSHLARYGRPDKAPNNVRVLLVDPGFTRTPSTRRWLTLGTLWGLFAYLVTYPLWWLVLKSPDKGAQSFLYAAMEARFGAALGLGEGQDEGVRMVKECREVPVMRVDVVKDEKAQQKLWQETEELILKLEKEGAVKRSKEKEEDKTAAASESRGGDARTGNTASDRVPGSRRSRRAG